MIPAPMVRMWVLRALGFGLLLCSVAPLRSVAGADPSPPSALAAPAQITSAEDWDWHDMLPYLYEATFMPPEQGLKELLENSRVLRSYVAGDVQAHCNDHAQLCGARFSDSALQSEITREIDAIVQEGLFRKRKVTRVDCPLTRRPFPFTNVVALKTTNHHDAYVVLDFANDSYTALQVHQKYGAPYDVMVFEWFTMHKYKLETATYVAKAAFTISPADGYVHRVAISLKRKEPHKSEKR